MHYLNEIYPLIKFAMGKRGTSILVVGSSNTDMVVKTAHLPGPGQTVLGEKFLMNSGGKGANQAVAAARLGGNVTFIARIGNDIFGAQALEQLKKEGIDCRHISTDPVEASGIALITVDQHGENSIAVAPGANALLSPADIERARDAIQQADVILVQLEIPLETVGQLVHLAAELGKRVILNPAPARDLPDTLLSQLAIITPNETEAELLTGISVRDPDAALQAAKVLQERGVPIVIITLGVNGALVWDGKTSTHLRPPPVEAVDTTAAGDIFNGALAVALSEGMNLREAAGFANRAAAFSVTRLGAQASAPSRSELVPHT
jgi:ribokinase